MAQDASASWTARRGSEGRISGYVLKVIREGSRLTQEQFAERLGVSAATVQGWESGRRPLLAMPAGNLMALRAYLRHLGAAPAILDALLQGLEADLFVGEILATPHHRAHPDGHLLGGWVVTRPFAEMTAWPIGAATPYAVERSTRRTLRHGPVPSGPVFGVDERQHIAVAGGVSHLPAFADALPREPHERPGRSQARSSLTVIGL